MKGTNMEMKNLIWHRFGNKDIKLVKDFKGSWSVVCFINGEHQPQYDFLKVDKQTAVQKADALKKELEITQWTSSTYALKLRGL